MGRRKPSHLSFLYKFKGALVFSYLPLALFSVPREGLSQPRDLFLLVRFPICPAAVVHSHHPRGSRATCRDERTVGQCGSQPPCSEGQRVASSVGGGVPDLSVTVWTFSSVGRPRGSAMPFRRLSACCGGVSLWDGLVCYCVCMVTQAE